MQHSAHHALVKLTVSFRAMCSFFFSDYRLMGTQFFVCLFFIFFPVKRSPLIFLPILAINQDQIRERVALAKILHSPMLRDLFLVFVCFAPGGCWSLSSGNLDFYKTHSSSQFSPVRLYPKVVEGTGASPWPPAGSTAI